MTGFEQAFSDGERAAFEDKRAGRRLRIKPEGELRPLRQSLVAGLHAPLNGLGADKGPRETLLRG